MKRNLLIILMLVLAVSLTACSTKSEDETPVTPDTENVEDMGDVEEDTPEEPQDQVDNNEESEVEDTEDIEDANDSEENEENTDSEGAFSWPNDFMPNVPEFQGKIFKFTEKQDDVHIYIGFEDVSHEEAVNYVDALKEAGFTKDSNGYSSNGTVNYKGLDKDNNFVKFHWSQNGYAGVDMIKK